MRGVAHGLGKFNFKGGVGRGVFHQGQLHGQALITIRGTSSVCNFQEGVRTGYGKLYWADGTRGKVNKQETQDISGWANYIGEWKEGKPKGQGTCYCKNGGVVQIGEWENNLLMEGQESYLKEDNSRNLYNLRRVNGKLVKV